MAMRINPMISSSEANGASVAILQVETQRSLFSGKAHWVKLLAIDCQFFD
ncbi:MAG: hypothetical protein RL650_243 [Pseudomonadota bacterium]|jgi:hypothetical protein